MFPPSHLLNESPLSDQPAPLLSLLGAKDSLEKKLQGRQSEVSQLNKDAEDSKKKHVTDTSEMRERIKQLEARTAWLQDDYGRKYTEWSRSSNSHGATSRELSEAQCKLEESLGSELQDPSVRLPVLTVP